MLRCLFVVLISMIVGLLDFVVCCWLWLRDLCLILFWVCVGTYFDGLYVNSGIVFCGVISDLLVWLVVFVVFSVDLIGILFCLLLGFV